MNRRRPAPARRRRRASSTGTGWRWSRSTGPFLTLPVLRQTWPTLDALDSRARDALRRAHAHWRADTPPAAAWIEFVLARPARLGASGHRGPTSAVAGDRARARRRP